MFLIYGKGKSGVAVEKLAQKKGFETLLVDDGDFKEKYLEKTSTIIISPGIPFFHPIFKLARSRNIPIIGEVEFAYRFWKGKIIAVTGTDGKSTTTKLIYDILKDSKKDVFIGGNYGIPFSEIVLQKETGTAVLELSSFQIYSTQYFRPDTAVFLNISVDHLDWHKRFLHYLISKYKLFKRQTSENYAVLNYDNPYIYKTKTLARKVYFSLKPLPDEYEGAFLKDNWIYVRRKEKEEKFLNAEDLPVKGLHFIQNTMAALLVSEVQGIQKNQIEKSLKSFKPLPFRLEYEGKVKGVHIYNDAKSTTVQSLLMAIRSFPDKNIVLIAGGINKGGNFSVLKNEKNIKKVILIGRDKDKIKKMLQPEIKPEIADSLERAFSKALYYANKEDIILFSPACASFDMFKNYMDRGEKFKSIVNGFKENI